MIEVNEQELLLRAEKVYEKTESYKTLIFANEIFKHKSKAYLAALKMQYREVIKDQVEPGKLIPVIKVSEVEAESRAMASKEWNDYLDKEMKTLKDAGRAKMELEGAQARFEAMRSALSARKAEINSFGG